MAKRQSTLPTWFASTSRSSPKKARLTGFCNYLVFYELVSTFCFMDLFVLLLYGLFVLLFYGLVCTFLTS